MSECVKSHAVIPDGFNYGISGKITIEAQTVINLRDQADILQAQGFKTDFDGGWDLSLSNPNHNHVP